MQSELKPCPFCGSDRLMVLPPTCDRDTPYSAADRAYPVVRCSDCYTDVPGKDFDASSKSAVEAWNRRSLTAALSDKQAVKVKAGSLAAYWEAVADVFSDMDINITQLGGEPREKLAKKARETAKALNRSALVDVPVDPVGYVNADFQKELSCYDSAVMFPNDRSTDHFKCIPVYAHPPLSHRGEDSAEVDRLTRPIVGIEHRTAQEVFDIMADRIRLAATRSASATTAKGCADV